MDEPEYKKLTSLLHWKPDTPTITEAELDTIYRSIFPSKERSRNGSHAMVKVIHEQAQECLLAPSGVNFENKIVLAIAIRLAAEEFMVGKIGDPTFVSTITSDQTAILLHRYKETFTSEIGNINTLESVALMTPENIHLNSFMYEPIVDMSDEHLRKLYTDVMGLK